MEIAPLEDDGRLVSKRLEIVAELVQRDTGLDCHGEIGLIDGEDLVHLLVGHDNVTTNKARRDGVHGSNDFDFGIFGIGVFDDCLNFADGAGSFELVVRDVELDLVVPVDEARHVGCENELDRQMFLLMGCLSVLRMMMWIDRLRPGLLWTIGRVHG